MYEKCGWTIDFRMFKSTIFPNFIVIFILVSVEASENLYGRDLFYNSLDRIVYQGYWEQTHKEFHGTAISLFYWARLNNERLALSYHVIICVGYRHANAFPFWCENRRNELTSIKPHCVSPWKCIDNAKAGEICLHVKNLKFPDAFLFLSRHWTGIETLSNQECIVW